MNRMQIAKLQSGHNSAQSGMVLVTIVIISILVGITAFSAIRNSNVELQIASGAKQRSQMFNLAELVISEAETSITDMSKAEVLQMIAQTNTFINQKDNDQVARSIDWGDTDLPIVPSDYSSETAGQGQYIIQYLNRRSAFDESLNITSAHDSVSYKGDYFLVTARFTSANSSAVREIQTVFSIEVE